MKFYSAASAALLFFAIAARAQTTAFTYQGQLNSSNAPASGLYDFRFRLFDVNSNVVAGPLTNSPVNVTNGFFLATLDFGAAVFDGSGRWLEIAVRGYGDTNDYTALSPLQQITSTPYAIRAINASNSVSAANLTAPLQATNMTGTISVANLPANVALLNSNQTFIGANVFNGFITATNAANIFAGAFSGAFSGNGFGQTNLSTTNLIGTLPDARLSTNVPLLNGSQTFSGANVFRGAVTATNPADVFVGAFTGNGIGQTNLAATNLVGTIPDARLSANVPLLNISNNFSSNVTAVLFTGSGHGLTNVPGAFFWVTVPGTSVPAQPNVGYICTNSITPVTITLPSSPSIGDTYKVAGIGGAGWIIVQNTNQIIFSGNLSSSVGQNWKTNGPIENWSAIASSADGTELAAAVNNGYIYTSADSGVTWTQQINSNSRYWSSIASSSDGTKLVAAVGYTIYTAGEPGAIYTSTDSGVTWTSHTSSPLSSTLDWSSVASSADGSKLVAAVRDGTGQGIYLSSNSGGNWSLVSGSPGYLWTSVASSSDGSKLVAVEETGDQIYISTNSGSSWYSNTNLYPVKPTSAASSSDGTRLVVAGNGGQIYVSTDFGSTWFLETTVSGQTTSVASSSDGSRLVATTGGLSLSGNIYSSQDSGANWTQLAGAPVLSWSDIASSADGSLLAATVYGGVIYVSSQNSTTAGTSGYLSGPQHSTIELIYAGNGIFLPLNHEGTIRAY